MRRVVPVLAAIAVLVGVAFALGRASAQGSPVPGSQDDPLVTKSYVDSAIQGLQSSLPKLVQDALQSQGAGTANFQVVTVAAGSSVVGNASTEMVVRAGKATAIASSNGGVSDLTGGRDLPQGAPAPANHLLLIPRTDGRGLTAVTNVILLISGPYTVKP